MFVTDYLSQFLYVIRNNFCTSFSNEEVWLQSYRQFHRGRDGHSHSLAAHCLHLVGQLLMGRQISCQLLCYLFQIVGPVLFRLLPSFKSLRVGLGALLLRAAGVLAADFVIVIVPLPAADGPPEPFWTEILEALHLALGGLERQHCFFTETVLPFFPGIGEGATEE